MRYRLCVCVFPFCQMAKTWGSRLNMGCLMLFSRKHGYKNGWASDFLCPKLLNLQKRFSLCITLSSHRTFTKISKQPTKYSSGSSTAHVSWLWTQADHFSQNTSWHFLFLSPCQGHTAPVCTVRWTTSNLAGARCHSSLKTYGRWTDHQIKTEFRQYDRVLQRKNTSLNLHPQHSV